MKSLKYLFHSGKNPKFIYYMKSAALTRAPLWLLRPFCRFHSLAGIEKRGDYHIIDARARYYCRLSPGCIDDRGKWLTDSVEIGKQGITHQKVYYFDSMTYARWFNPADRWILLPGDITYVPELPSIVKSRPIDGDNANSVVLKLDKVRHFIFLHDSTPFEGKADRAIFRGKVDGKSGRLLFVEKFFGNPRFDIGTIDLVRPEWKCEKLSLYDHLKYRYIMCLEGNDVASNLKWVMSSNSIAVMPRPRYETWFMEGTLKPGVHYIEVKPDFSDLEERLDYYSSHPDEAKAIIRNAHEYVSQFMNPERENHISMLVLDRYLKACAGK